MAECGLCAFGRTVLLHQVEAGERHVEPRALRVLEQHKLRVAVALIDFLQTLILTDSVFHMDDIVANLKVAEVRKKRGNLGFLPLWPGNYRLGFIEQIARAKNGEVGVGQD